MLVWLRAIRDRENLSQADVSKAVNITQASYSNIEAGKRRPSILTAKKIATALGFNWTMFFDEQELPGGNDGQDSA